MTLALIVCAWVAASALSLTLILWRSRQYRVDRRPGFTSPTAARPAGCIDLTHVAATDELTVAQQRQLDADLAREARS